MSMSSSSAFSVLEQTILKAKGLSEENLATLQAAGVASKADFGTIGTAETLLEIMPSLDAGVAAKVMEWAVGAKPVAAAPPVATGDITKLFVDSADATYCVHCNAKQPKDYSTGDLCPSCGKQAEPVQSCYWCGQGGPGKFCRGCGAEFDLAVLLKREGVAKEEISRKLRDMAPADKDILWGRVRRGR
jgi:hypothetical protein